jgi:tubulin alpha
LRKPYNALLTTHWLLDHTEISVLLDNEAMYEICQKHLDIRRPSYDTLNRLIAKAVSSMTTSLRFEGELNVDLSEFQTNVVAFPRLHFMITAMAPITTQDKKETTNNENRPITELCFSAQNVFAKLADFDAEEDKYMAVSDNYRGQLKAKEANATVQWLKPNKKVTFVEWVPTGFKVGFNEVPAARVGNIDETAISRVFSERIARKYDLMCSRRAFVS